MAQKNTLICSTGLFLYFLILIYFLDGSRVAAWGDEKLLSLSSSLQVYDLTTEYLKDPLGVDVRNPRLSWKLFDRDGQRGLYQSSYEIQVSSWDPSTNKTKQWTCSPVQSTKSHLVSLFLLLRDQPDSISGKETCQGLKLQSDTRYEWQVTVTASILGKKDVVAVSSPKASFQTGLLNDNDWQAEWITGGNDKNLLRTFFEIPNIKSHATLFISAVGYYVAHLNGKRVGDHQLDPGWTDPRKRVWYVTHDVTNLIRPGKKNVIGIMLGNGWWSCGPPPGTNMPTCRKDPPQVKVQLQIDGHAVLISHTNVSKDDFTWKAMAGPITYNSLYNGETFDARIAERIRGWTSDTTTGTFDATLGAGWIPARQANSVANNVTVASQLFEPIRHIATRPPTSIWMVDNTNSSSLVQVVDFGQNQAALVRLKRIHCPRGAKIVMRHAEALTHSPYGPADGSIYVGNLRSALATDTYICRGDPDGESYTPTFTQHGFRYAEVTGLAYPLKETDIEAVELHSDVTQTSSIQFSEKLLNEIQHLCIWSQKSNLMSLPTDCPQRDERRGWLGDTAMSAEEAVYNFGMAPLYRHYLDQIVDAQSLVQNCTGCIPNVAPIVDDYRPGAPNWQSGFPMIVWVLYKYYGDISAAVRHHDALVLYVDYLEGQYNDTAGLGDFREGYGDWCPPVPHPKSDGHLLGAFALIHDLQLVAELFAASTHAGANYQARRCSNLVPKLKNIFHQTFFNETTGYYYMSGLQTEQALPLWLNAVPSDDVRSKVLDYLVHDIQERQGGHTTSGIVGIKFGMEVLSELGRTDVALGIALQKTYPSWGYMIQNSVEPATSLWELWNGNTEGNHMNSRNHIMFGSVSSWLYKYLAGIQPAQPGFSSISIRPSGHSVLNHVEARVVTPYGDIFSGWKIDNNRSDSTWSYTHTLALPSGTNTILLVPAAIVSEGGDSDMVITEGGAFVWLKERFVPGVSGILNASRGKNGIEFHLLSGKYKFLASAPGKPKETLSFGRSITE